MPDRLLAIDVTGPGGGAALLADGEVMTSLLPPEVARGRDLVPALRTLLSGAGLSPGDLACVACGVGPGSFTGIRIGIATAAAFAFAASLPVLGVGSLDGIAANAPDEAREVLVALDARRGRVFSCRYRRVDGEWVAQGPYAHVRPEEAVAGLSPETWILGDARERYDALDGFPGTSAAPPRPDAIARIAAARFARGERSRPDELAPLYLRRSDPELRREERT